MATWDDTLSPYKLDGIEFEASARPRRGGRAIVARKYPNRDGQDVEDLGREPYRYELVVPLFHGVNPEHWPNLFDQLVAVLENPPANLEYQDPEHGVVTVTVVDWDDGLDSGQRDGTILKFTLEERMLDVVNLGRTLTTSVLTDPTELAAQLDDAMAEAGIDENTVKAGFAKAGAELDVDEQGDPGTLWESQIAETMARIDDGAAAADVIVSQVERVRVRLDVLTSTEEARTADGQPVYEAAMLLAASLEQRARAFAADAPSLVEHRVLVETSIFEIANSLYSDPARVADLLARNPMADALFIPAGTVLVVADR
jgi:prophage DNA circulation protein